MQSHELLKEVLQKISAKQVSSELGLSLSLIYKWAEPAAEGSGAAYPLRQCGKRSTLGGSAPSSSQGSTSEFASMIWRISRTRHTRRKSNSRMTIRPQPTTK